VRVLIFTQFFTPEVGATQTRLHTFAAGLAERGHDVEVICEVPNHPQGLVRPGYGGRGRLVDRRSLESFRVRYVWVRTSPTKTTRSRLAFYGSYMAMAVAVGSFTRRPDVIFASSPPLPVAAAAAIVSRRHRVPWVMDVRDLWPEVAVAVGELSNPRMLAAAERLERRLYASAAAITTVTEPFRESIATKVGNAEKIHLLPNGTTRLYLDAARLEPDRASLELPKDKFIWTYAGNVGVAQGLETAVDAAGLLGDEFGLLILGDGPVRRRLEERATSHTSGSVFFRDQVPEEDAVRYLRASDALLVPLAADPVLEKFVPSKLYDFCAVGRPVVVAAAGEAQRLAESGGTGIAVAPGDPDELAGVVRRLRLDRGLRRELSRSGRAFARLRTRESGVMQLTALLEDVAVDVRYRGYEPDDPSCGSASSGKSVST
jgi:glycosyltransferase involved in cell wall biosynthesis